MIPTFYIRRVNYEQPQLVAYRKSYDRVLVRKFKAWLLAFLPTITHKDHTFFQPFFVKIKSMCWGGGTCSAPKVCLGRRNQKNPSFDLDAVVLPQFLAPCTIPA